MNTRESIILYLSIFGAKILIKDEWEGKLSATVSYKDNVVTMECTEFNLYRWLYWAALKVYLLNLTADGRDPIVFTDLHRQYLRTIFNSYLKYRAASLIKWLDITAPRWSSVFLLEYPHFEFMYNILECEEVRAEAIEKAITLLFS